MNNERNMTAVPFQFLKDVSSFPYPDADDTVLNFVPNGWKPAFLETCKRIQEVFDRVEVSSIHFRFDQVKEKFGALRVYWHVDYDCTDGANWAVLNGTCGALIDDLEQRTSKLCIECGQPATRISNLGWILPYCNACARQKYAEYQLTCASAEKSPLSFDQAFLYSIRRTVSSNSSDNLP